MKSLVEYQWSVAYSIVSVKKSLVRLLVFCDVNPAISCGSLLITHKLIWEVIEIWSFHGYHERI